MRRCYSKNNKSFENYGDRGILVCDEWKSSKIFLEWVDSLGGITNGYELDRIDNNGNYEPKNCRFVSSQVNSQNRRSTKLSLNVVKEVRDMYKSNNLCVDAVAKDLGVAKNTLIAAVQGKTWSNL